MAATLNCQKCRQPLTLDGSLENLNPAAYDLLVSSPSPQILRKPSTPRSLLPRPHDSARKSVYAQASQDSGPPTFKRNHAGQNRDPTMSFIYLTESQLGHSEPSSKKGPPTFHRASSSALSRDDNTQAKENQMDRINRLFEILSARSDVDHPVCVDCTDMLLDGFQKKLDSVSRERDAYVKHLKDVQSNRPNDGEIKEQRESLGKAEKDKSSALEELKKLEAEKDALDNEITKLERESQQLDKEENQFWKERNMFAMKMADFQSERDSLNAKYSNDSQLLQKLQRSNVYNDTFCISHDGSFATINGLRLGRLSNRPVDWPEINAAWGHSLLLLVTVAEKLGYKFRNLEPQPMGSTSKIIRYEESSPISSRVTSRPTQAPAKKQVLELYSSGDMPLGLTFMHRKFDNAMVAFLELVRQLGVFVAESTESVAEEPLELPYQIDGDKIADVSIKLGIAQDDGWTKACKLTLTCCKFLLAHASNVTTNGKPTQS